MLHQNNPEHSAWTLDQCSTLLTGIWRFQVRSGSRPPLDFFLVLGIRDACLKVPRSFSAAISLVQQLIDALSSRFSLFSKLAISYAPYDMAEIDAQFQHHAVDGLARN